MDLIFINTFVFKHIIDILHLNIKGLNFYLRFTFVSIPRALKVVKQTNNWYIKSYFIPPRKKHKI